MNLIFENFTFSKKNKSRLVKNKIFIRSPTALIMVKFNRIELIFIIVVCSNIPSELNLLATKSGVKKTAKHIRKIKKDG